ncbi:16S rRNA (adenine(1518)-N(6)/adenine(1519)-N(6))-dimethyltransferase RsmA [bacterium]|nr:16S rRNA (adenine(1518)-N(6)/adenine(1519)-N(6))-dimethyltransferase RsmA [bacterium]
MSRPKLGQVFLIDTNIVQKIVQTVCLNSTDNVIEIGCGDGILTSALAEVLDMLTVIEIDESCIQRSQDQLGVQKGIRWVHQDVLTYDFSEQGKGIRVVANIPYYISSPLIQRFAYDKQRFKDITLMVQKEFAQKAVGKPGQKLYTPLTVFMQFHFDVEYLFTVSKSCFKPVPKIDSAIMRLVPKQRDVGVNEALFETIVKACFWGKRKKLSTALNKNPHVTFTEDVKSIKSLSNFVDKRADQLTVDDYISLSHYLEAYVETDL